MDKKHCGGCYNDDYNRGFMGVKECWSLATAKLIKRKRVPVTQVPPWKQQAVTLPSCYRQPGYAFVGPKDES